DVTFVLVPSQPLVARMAQAACLGPLGEPDLGDGPGPDPVHAATRHVLGIGERGGVVGDTAQLVVQLCEHVRGERGSHLAGIAQAAVVVVPDEQRAQTVPAPLRLRVSTDHQLLVAYALELQPVRRTAVVIGAVTTLGDDSLPAL